MHERSEKMLYFTYFINLPVGVDIKPQTLKVVSVCMYVQH